jgi:hypothetical protein
MNIFGKIFKKDKPKRYFISFNTPNGYGWIILNKRYSITEEHEILSIEQEIKRKYQVDVAIVTSITELEYKHWSGKE